MLTLTQPASILVIDDYLLMRKNLQSILTLAGYQVYATSNVADAIHVLHTAEINLILSDMMLAGINSLPFYRQVKSRERWQQIPFIFISGNISKLEEVKPQLTADGTICLSKPFAVQGLLDTVAQALAPVCAG